MSTEGTPDILISALRALHAGDLSSRMPEDGALAQVAREHNQFMDRLQTLRSEHARLTREVGKEGRFGGQAEVPGAQGVWKELNDNLNDMSRRITDQIRDISAVTHAVATGDLSKKITVDAGGETLELKNMINLMVDKLNSFAYELTLLQRQMSTDGILGTQMDVRGVTGTWNDLVDSLNISAANLTAQIRGIARTVDALARGDAASVEDFPCRGEMKELKANLKTLAANLARPDGG